MLLNIKISQTATTSEPTTNTLFIKTQRKYTRQPGQLLLGTRYSNHEKVIFFIFRQYETHKKICLIWSKFKTQGTNNNFNNNVSAQKTKLLHCNQILTIFTFIPDKHAKYQ